MFKKTRTILTFATFLSSTSLSLANGASYMGGSVGVSGAYWSHHGLRMTGLNSSLFGGYGATLGVTQRWYLGGEADVHVGRGAHNYFYDSNYYGVGASFMPGVMVTPSTLLYTKLGVEVNHAEHGYDSITFNTVTGLGLQTEVSDKVSLRGEYLANFNMSGQFNLGLVYKFV